jgi:type IV secretion system protein TrbE
VQFAEYASNIICLDENRECLEQTVRLVSKVIQQLGFASRLEDVNAIEAWRGSLPGDGYSNVRGPILHTLNLAHMLPITSVWAGLRENPSQLMPRNSPPLLYAATSGSTPFRFWLHVSDVALIVAQWFRYPRARVFWFDKGYSAWH